MRPALGGSARSRAASFLARAIVIATLCLAGSGCATGLVTYKAEGRPILYGGTLGDLAFIVLLGDFDDPGRGALGAGAIVDLPLSFATDTVLLPFAGGLYLAAARREARADEARILAKQERCEAGVAYERPPERACEMGDALACAHLGDKYHGGYVVERDAAKAAQYFRKGCEAGDSVSCVRLGDMYRKGDGVVRNVEEAARLYRQSCERGKGGCLCLSELCKTHTGIGPDTEEAARFYLKACEGQLEPGTSLTSCEEAVKRDQIRKACEAGDAERCFDLGERYYLADPGDRHSNPFYIHDNAEAAWFFRLACAGGVSDSCFRLGQMHQKGIGVEKSLSEAARFYREACEAGSKYSCRALDGLAGQGPGPGGAQ